ncbi:MAG TPA: tRNA1(Val) (adenine(37)-N6)-methyltransferase [Candidatus Scybalousia intestinigallinarum]|nr:tRNA1(Val) (adenine(37)-N6)-methyltransferase [Candidatus Scybalousia intestinigallinarum]
MEVLHDLVGFQNFKIFQNTDWFSFSLDSVLLPNFVTLNHNIERVLDLGTGNAPIPMILSLKTNAKIVAVEIQEDLYKLAQKNIDYNHLRDRIELLHLDMKKLREIYLPDTFDVITCNPPYFKYLKTSHLNEDEHKVIARHEKLITLEDIFSLCFYLLKNQGVLGMVHRTDRLVEIIHLANQYHLEIKRLRLVYPKENSDSNLVLIEFRKNGKTGLKILPPLYVHHSDGSYTNEVLNMFKESETDESK